MNITKVASVKNALVASAFTYTLLSTSHLAQAEIMFENDPFSERRHTPSAPLSAQQRLLMQMRNTSEEGADNKNSPRDKEMSTLDTLRVRSFKNYSFHRNVSNIMSTKLYLANGVADGYQYTAPERVIPENWPEDPEDRKKLEAELEERYQRQLNYYTARREVESVYEAIMLGQWGKVETYLKSIDEDVAKSIYLKITHDLGKSGEIYPSGTLSSEGTRRHKQAPVMPLDDILRWSDTSPKAPTTRQIASLATMIIAVGDIPESFYTKLTKGTKYLGGEKIENRLRAAELLLAIGQPKRALAFLGSAESAVQSKNYKAVDLLSLYHESLLDVEPHAPHLQNAWLLSQWLLKEEKVPSRYTRSAMMRSFYLLPRLKDKEAAGRWFKETFQSGESKGMRLLSHVGLVAADCAGNTNAAFRASKIQLQHATATALIQASPDQLERWQEIMQLYAKNWLREAELSYKRDKSSSSGPTMQRDQFGNVFYAEQKSNSDDKKAAQPISAIQIIQTGPNQLWLSLLDEPTQLACLKNYARLFLKIKEDKHAFPYIEKIAKINKAEAQSMVSELISVWADNHDPNAQQSYRNSWQYSYGHNNRADSIPLSRSKQQRNLKQLKQLVNRLNSMGITRNDEVQLAQAFIRCHSQAEIWRMDTFEDIFGKTEALSPETISAVLDTMRRNLVRVWPNKKLQKQAKTKRTDVELQQEVIRGYTSAIALAEQTLKKHPKVWQLALQKATLKFSYNGYLNQIEKNSNALAKKKEALADYQTACDIYLASLKDPKTKGVSLQVFENWFYAALGAADLSTLRSYHQPSHKQFDRIRAAIEGMPPHLAKLHMDHFANMMSVRIASVGPDLKLRYLKAGLSIVGDNPRAEEAHKLSTYYQDLVTEIELVTKIDGDSTINPEKPFGLIVYLRHSKEIEREAGGFQKYLQNQSASGANNYGRPSEDYRDKFENSARAALEEYFEVESVTFHPSDVESYTDKQHGWRVTPYAYITMKAKDAKIDSVPPLQIDFDFLDTSGYVVIPVASPILPIDCSGGTNATRPYHNLQVTQTFDDRSTGKSSEIILEIKAKGYGILPSAKELLQLDQIEGFEITKVDDRGNQVQELDAAAVHSPAMSERYIQVHLKPLDGKMPSQFTFPPVLATLASKEGLSLNRYEDVDLVEASPTISLQASPNNTKLLLFLFGGLLVTIGIGLGVYRSRRKLDNEEVIERGVDLPDVVTPVNALGILDKFQADPTLSDAQKLELKSDMEIILSAHFGKETSEDLPNPLTIVEKWVNQVNPST